MSASGDPTTATVPPDVDLTGQVAVVTGATGGMGRVLALELARAGAHVVAVVRTPARGQALAAHVRASGGRGVVTAVVADLTRRDDVLGAAATVAARHEAVHLLVNNAGAHFPDHRLSVDGVEMHLALDYLAGYGLTTALAGPLGRGRARVVDVASDSLNDSRRFPLPGRARPATLDLTGVDDLRRLHPAEGFRPFAAYARAKLMTVTAGYALAERLAPDGVTVNAVHPGIVATGLVDDLVPRPLRPFGRLIRRGMLTPEQGAGSALRLAVDPALDGVTGRYFRRDEPAATPPVSHDRALQQRLLALSDAHFAGRAVRTGAGPAERDGPPRANG